MTIFQSYGNPGLAIYSPRLGHTIRFEDGRYETTDPDELALLRRLPSVDELDEMEHGGVVPEPGPVEGDEDEDEDDSE